ncbi:hypothetical protein JCM5353_008865 [Sporobolomyces roseus]
MTQLDSPSPTSSAPQYVLSAILSGHTDDVRSLASTSTSSSKLFSASRDGTARGWNRGHDGWEESERWEKGHEGFVNAVCYLDQQKEVEGNGLSQGYLLTAGQDGLIQVYSPPSQEPVQTLLGHGHNVCCLHTDKKGKRVASGSWDMTARIWNTKNWECERVLVDHGAAVWNVMLVDDDEELCLTAAADNYVRLFDGVKVRHLFKGHTGPVRALSKILPDDESSKLFASASNDGTVRIWNYLTGDALTILNHEDFVYSLVSIPSLAKGGLASSGEDGLIKIWNESDGECDQVIEVPALSVWSLAILPNGDLACGCSDNLIWIFTRSGERLANELDQKEYEAKLEVTRANKRKSERSTEPVAVIHEVKDLENPGRDVGEIKLVRDDSGISAYQLNSSNWENLGQVVDPPTPRSSDDDASSSSPQTSKKMVHEGKEYDYVFQIDVSDDTPPLPLTYNLEDDVYEVAKRFVFENKLPESYLEQIVSFVRVNTTRS